MTAANLEPAAKEEVIPDHVSPRRLGLALGAFLGLWHAFWALLVWTGAAQPVMDFIFRLHMIVPPYKIAEFNGGDAAALVLVTSILGYVFGWVLGFLWKRFRASTF